MNQGPFELPSWDLALSLAERILNLSKQHGSRWPTLLRTKIEDAAVSQASALFRAHHRSANYARISEVDTAERHLLDLRCTMVLAHQFGAAKDLEEAEKAIGSLLNGVKTWLAAAHHDAARRTATEESHHVPTEHDEMAKRHREMMEELRRLGKPGRH